MPSGASSFLFLAFERSSAFCLRGIPLLNVGRGCKTCRHMSGDWLVSVVWILASATTLIRTCLFSCVPMATMPLASYRFLVLDTYNLDGNWTLKCYDSPFVALRWVAWVNYVAVSVSHPNSLLICFGIGPQGYCSSSWPRFIHLGTRFNPLFCLNKAIIAYLRTTALPFLAFWQVRLEHR